MGVCSYLRRGACALGALALVSFCDAAWAQTLPAFSGADGAAMNAVGGRGGIVYHVTKLNSAIDDPQRNDVGTIRYGLNSANFPANTPRTIVFDVGGVFQLGRLPQLANNGWDPNGNGWDAQSRLTIGGSNVTLAGQTAPGAGVIFMGGGLKPQGNNNIIRNITIAAGYGLQGWWSPGAAMRAAPGTPEAGTDASQWFPDNTVYDGMDISGTNLMIDHVSTLFATDEAVSMNEVANNITVQYSNISQPMNYPQWDAEGGGSLTGHAFGSLLEAGPNAAISFHHNLYAHHKGRVPQIAVADEQPSGGYYDFRNNVFYNWLGTAGGRSGTTFLNLASNFYLAGDGGDSPAGGTNPAINQAGGGTGVLAANATSVYRNGNLSDINKDADANDITVVANGGPANPLWAGGVQTYNGVTDPAATAYSRVLDYVGANWWNRDATVSTPDERIIQETRTGTGKIIAWADNPWDANDGAEWQALKNTVAVSRAADWDTDQDGMPAYWEAAHGLNAAVADNNGDFDTDGYTNLEEYLNEVAAWPAPAPIVFNGTTNDRYAQITNWDANADAVRTHNWQPARFDEAQIRSGLAVIDSVGQHAGTLKVGAQAGDDASLGVESGWLEVASELIVGGAGTGAVYHVGGVVAADGVTLGGPIAGSPSGAYHLWGVGVLRVSTLAKGAAGGEFDFLGGTLSAGTVQFSLVNKGGTIAPGASAGTMYVVGDLTINSGTLAIELGVPQPGEYDEVVVSGALTAGGTMAVTFLNGYTPQPGDAWNVLDFASAGGSFTYDLPTLGAYLDWNTDNVLTTGALSVVALNADFDGDDLVDGDDLLIWQRGLGLTGQMDRTTGDANQDGAVDADDLAVWQNQFGTNPTAQPPAVGVPEPAGSALAAIALVALRAVCPRRRAKK